MSVDQVTAAQFASQLAQAILARNSSYDVQIGPIQDLSIIPVAKVAEGQNTRLRQIQSLLLLLNDGNYTRADLEAFVFNEGITPDQGAPAIVTLIFSSTNITADQTIQQGYPVGTLSDESTGRNVTFVTLQTQTLPVATKSQYFNANTQRYELPVVARCTTGGTVGLVAAGRITRPLRPLVGFDAVFNRLPSIGGRDPSSDTDLIEQYLIAITGSALGTPDGLRRTTRDLFTAATDYLPVYGSDPLLTRAATDAGAVDLWILGDQPVAQTDLATFIGINQPIPLLQQPVDSVVDVNAGAFVLGVDYLFVKDTGTYSGSVRGADAIVFTGLGATPAVGDALTINYTQNSLIASIQNAYNAPDKLEMGRDLLARASIAVPVTIRFTLYTRSGFDPTAVQTLVAQNVEDFVGSLLLAARIPTESDGGALQKSDVDQVIRRVSGVDNVIFTRFDVQGGVGNADVPVGKNQYVTLDPLQLVITPG